MRGKDILLINPPPSLKYWEEQKSLPIYMPVGLMSIAAVLSERGYNVKIIDGMIEKDYLRIIKENLGGILFIGISAMTVHIPPALEIAKMVREVNSRVPIVWGGVHPTLFPKETLEDLLVDLVCIGEGEYTSVDLADALNGLKSISSVKGIGYKKGGNLFFNAPREFLNLDNLPPLSYESLDLEKYLYRDLGSTSFGKGVAKVITIHSGRGCPYKCSFCINTHPSQKYRQKGANLLLKETEDILRKYQPEVIYFQDDNFFADKKRTLEFFKGVKERGYKFKWFAVTRANYFNQAYLSENFWENYAESCLYLGIGIESGSERIRNKILNKALRDSQIESALRICNKFLIPVGCSFMTAIPGETLAERIKTVEYIMRIKSLYSSTECSIQYYQPYPGAPLFEKAIEMGFTLPKNLREWSQTVNPDEWYGWYIPIDRLPWIENKPMIEYLMWIIPFYTSCSKRKAKKLKLLFSIGKPFVRLSLFLRIKTGFWDGFIELYFIKFARAIKRKISSFKI